MGPPLGYIQLESILQFLEYINIFFHTTELNDTETRLILSHEFATTENGHPKII